MSYLSAVDISQYQAGDDYNVPIIMMKASGGDAGLYFDARCTQHYYAAKHNGKAVGLYHFAGGGNPIAEAEFFVKACSPLEENDVLALDWEVQHPDPVGWCDAFVNRVHELTGVWPLLYINLATLRRYDWSRVLAKCGLWLAAWNGNPELDIDTGGYMYVMHQYRGAPLDLDAWFGTIEQFNKYGYHNAQTPQPTPQPQPEPTPAPEPIPEPVPPPAPSPTDYDKQQDEKITWLVSKLQLVWNYLLRYKLFQKFIKKG